MRSRAKAAATSLLDAGRRAGGGGLPVARARRRPPDRRVAIEAAASLGASPFAFLLAVISAAATSFMTPVGYQTNLMIYGPGNYEFTDSLRVGGPFQFLLSVVTTIGIILSWGV